MKKFFVVILALTLIFCIVIGAVACNNKDDAEIKEEEIRLTDPALAKVAEAFTGVERSMTRASSLSATLDVEKSLYLAGGDGVGSADGSGAVTEENALATIYSIYTQGDLQANASAELKYDEPPMMQFRYLKAVFEEMGDDYSLGTKYEYDITGQIYFDLTTGFPVDAKRSDAARYRYDYVFNFAISIELNEDDTIFAEVAFKIALSRDSENLATSWYVSFDLDYDFSKSDPTYTLLMYTDNKEGALPFLERVQGYEYDYVEVNKGSIIEWRKFVMDVDREITIDEAHPSFASYLEEDTFYFSADTAKWLKNGKFYKVTRLTSEKNLKLATAYVDGLGMNSTAINGGVFLSKSGTQSSIIETYYRKICEIYGGDIIYDLVCRDEDEGGGQGGGNHNGGNGADDSSSWASVIPATLTGVLPTFETSSASFMLETVDEGFLIRVRDAGVDDYSRFGGALEGAGFASAGMGSYYKNVDGMTIIVSVNPDQNAIFIGKQQGESKKSIEIPNGIDYVDGAIASLSMQSVSDYYQISENVEKFFTGKVNVKALSQLKAGSAFYDITLAYSSAPEDLTAERYAAGKANDYARSYLREGWTNRYNNTVNYSTQNGVDVLVLIASSGSGTDAHVYIYVLLFDAGAASGIVDGGNEEEIINEEGSSRKVDVTLYFLNGDKKEANNVTRTYYEGQEIDLNDIFESGLRAYVDAQCEHEYEGEITASDELKIYLWQPIETATKYDFVVYDVDGGVIQEKAYKEDKMGVGETGYYGYSFKRVVYWDEACTEPVPLDYVFTMTEEGIILYRDVTLDYVVVKLNYYLNGELFKHSETFYQRGCVYFASNNTVIDFGYYANFSRASAFYLGEDESGTPIEYGDRIAFIEDETTISGYGKSEEYRVYTVKAGEEELGKVVTNQPSAIVSYGAVSGENEVNGSTIQLKNATTYKTYRCYVVWKDRRVLSEESHFPDTYSILELGAEPFGESERYFHDAACTSPIVLDKDRSYVMNSSEILYTPLTLR